MLAVIIILTSFISFSLIIYYAFIIVNLTLNEYWNERERFLKDLIPYSTWIRTLIRKIKETREEYNGK